MLCEHFRRIFLIRLEFSEQDMHLGLVDLERVAAPDQDFMRLLVRQSQVDEVIDEAAELIKYQICVLFQLKLQLLLLRLHETFQTLEAFLEDGALLQAEAEGALLALILRFKLLSPLFPSKGILNLQPEHIVDSVAPVAQVRPDSMVSDERA